MSQLQKQRSASSIAMLNALSGLINLAKAPQISNKVCNEVMAIKGELVVFISWERLNLQL